MLKLRRMVMVLSLLKGEQLGLFGGPSHKVKTHQRKTEKGPTLVVEHQRTSAGRTPPKPKAPKLPKLPKPTPTASTHGEHAMTDDTPIREEFWIPGVNQPRLEADIARLAKRADKLGMPPPTLAWSGRTEEREVTKTMIMEGQERTWKETHTYHQAFVKGPVLKVGAWTLRGSAEPVSDGHNLVHSFGDKGLPARFRTTGSHCEHCNTNRARKQVHILQDDSGHYKQVGTSCLADFTGHSPQKAAAAMQYMNDVMKAMKDEDYWDDMETGKVSGAAFQNLTDVLVLAAHVIEEDGEFISVARGQSGDAGGKPTAWSVKDLLEGGAGRVLSNRAHYEHIVQGALAWMKSRPDDSTDFDSNMLTLGEAGIVPHKQIGVAVYAAAAFMKADREAELAKKLPPHLDAFFGQPGDKIGRKLSAADKRAGKGGHPDHLVYCTGRHSFEGAYGTTTILNFRGEDGHDFVWFSSSPGHEIKETRRGLYPILPGQRYSMKATIKGHKERKDVKQTQITRAKLTRVLDADEQAEYDGHYQDEMAHIVRIRARDAAEGKTTGRVMDPGKDAEWATEAAWQAMDKGQQLGMFGASAPSSNDHGVKQHTRRNKDGSTSIVTQHRRKSLGRKFVPRGPLAAVKGKPPEGSLQLPMSKPDAKPRPPKELSRDTKFKAWFKDSKVVKDGLPAEQSGPINTAAVVYHGTPVGGFQSFDPKHDKGHNIYGSGFYFTADKGIATEYTEKDLDDAIYQATGFNDADGNEIITLTPDKVPSLLYSSGFTYKGYQPSGTSRFDPPGKDVPVRTTRWPWSPDMETRSGAKAEISSHGNNRPNMLYAIHKASDDKGNVHIPTLLKFFWSPDPKDVEAHQKAMAGTYSDTIIAGGSDFTNQRYAVKALHERLGEGAMPITPDGQVFEVYLSLQNPIDMDAEATPEAVQRLSSHMAYLEAQASLDRRGGPWKPGRFDSKGQPDWMSDEDYAEQQSNQARRKKDHNGANAADQALVDKYESGKHLVHNVYVKSAADHLSDEQKTRLYSERQSSINITHADLLEIKQASVDATKGQEYDGRQVLGALHRTDRATLTWGDVQYLASDYQRYGDEKERFIAAAKLEGHDGLTHTGGWNIGTHEHQVYVAWEPTQIKATTSKSFDPSTADMYKGSSGLDKKNEGPTLVMRKGAPGMPGMPGVLEPAGQPPRPGLVLRPSKNGGHRRWQREGEDDHSKRQPRAKKQPEKDGPPKQGDLSGQVVSFKGEDGKPVKGKVTAQGPLGVTVESGGETHKVEHGDYSKSKGKATEAKSAPKAKSSKPKAKKESKVHDEPMPELEKGFNDLSKEERARKTADWSVVDREMSKRFKAPDLSMDNTADAVKGAKSFLNEMANKGFIGRQNLEWGNDILSTLGKHLKDSGVDDADAAALLSTSVRKLVHQEFESARRTLGDHGLRHLGHNIKAQERVFDAIEKGGGTIGPKDRLAAAVVMVTHDLGYSIPAIARGGFKVKDNYHPQASAEMWGQEVAADPALRRIFDDKTTTKMEGWIRSHSGSDIDWDNDPVGTAVRLADNTHLYSDKMPELLFDRPGAMELMVKLRLAADSGADWEPLKAALGAHIDGRTDLAPPQMAALKQAASEITPKTSEFLVSRLAGRDMSMSYDGNGKLSVNVEQSPLREMIGRVFGADDMDKQFVKMLGDFGHKPDGILEGQPPPSATLKGEGRSSIEMQWTKPKAKPTGVEQQYVHTMRRTLKEWDRIQGMEGKQQHSAMSAFFGKLAKAERDSVVNFVIGKKKLQGTLHARGKQGATIVDQASGQAHRVLHGDYHVPDHNVDTYKRAHKKAAQSQGFARMREVSTTAGDIHGSIGEDMQLPRGSKGRVLSEWAQDHLGEAPGSKASGSRPYTGPNGSLDLSNTDLSEYLSRHLGDVKPDELQRLGATRRYLEADDEGRKAHRKHADPVVVAAHRSGVLPSEGADLDMAGYFNQVAESDPLGLGRKEENER